MRLPFLRLFILASSLLSRNVASAFSFGSIFGKTEEETYSNTPPRDFVKEFGEDGYKRVLAGAFGEEYDEERKTSESFPTVEYGVDLSYPIHRPKVTSNYDWLPHNRDSKNNAIPSRYKQMPVQYFGDKQSLYDENIEGCRQFYQNVAYTCDDTERGRIKMNLAQPQSMQNYTDIGFKKIKAPATLMEMLIDFYESNKELATPEKWNNGNTYTNHWKVPTHMLSVEDSSIPKGGLRLKNKIWDAARETIEQWTGENLTPSSLYGIRIYEEGAILAPHVDRLPLVCSAIINVAQDVDEDWPIEVYGHDGKAYNITMEPGDMVLYESHSVIHGRPFPLKGRSYANVFIHFEPTGHSLRHEDKINGGDAEEQYMNARKTGKRNSETEDDLPPYILKGTTEEVRWRQENSNKKQKIVNNFRAFGSTEAHEAAGSGELDYLLEIAEDDESDLHASDINGWTPLHEAVRGGHIDIVEFLAERGTDINARTGRIDDVKGGSALWHAIDCHGRKHPIVMRLIEMGAFELGPEL